MLEGMEGVSTFAADVDRAFMVVNVITVFLFIVVIGSMLYFVYKYNSSKHPPEKAENIEHYTPIEIAWTVIPTILLGIIFYYGLDSLRMQRTMPKGDETLQIKVKAQKWSWGFEYANGKRSSTLVVPINTDVKLSMTAPLNDVLHSFYVPAFRTKEDIVPGQTTYLWFNATKKGKFNILCAEYCGTRHSYMQSFVEVVDAQEYKDWIKPKGVKSKKPKGLELIEQNGCLACHALDKNVLVGPGFKDIYNSKITVTSNGAKKELIRDDNYLKDAILNPNKDVVDGFYPDVMPSFKGVIGDDDVNEILKYLKGEIQEESPSKLDGKEILNNNGCLGCHSLDGTKMVGPSFKDIFNRKVKISINGELKEIVSNEQYLRKAILKPNAEVVEGYYPGIMPPFENVLKVEEVDAILQYFNPTKKQEFKINGKEILNNNGCLGCHSIDGSKIVGPSLKGIYNRKVKINVDGKIKEIESNDAYLKDALLKPNAHIVEGYYPGIMPSFKNVLKDDEINALIEYLKTIK